MHKGIVALILVLAFALLSLNSFAQQCVTPSSDMHLTKDTTLCAGNYRLEKGITIDSDGITLNCNNAALQGFGLGYGILLKARQQVRVTGCDISRFEAGIYLESSSHNSILSNQISKGRFGIVQSGSSNNTLAGNTFREIDRNNTIEFSAPKFEEPQEAQEPKREDKPSEEAVFEKALRLKNPQMDEREISSELDLIFNRYFNFTHENIEFRRAYLHNSTDNTTKIVLRLIPKGPLQNVSIYEQIPKCMAEFIEEVSFAQQNYEVLEADPLIVWHFDTLTQDELITYTVYNKVDDICKQLMLSFGIAQGFLPEKKEEFEEKARSNGLIPLAVISIVLMLLIMFFVMKSRGGF